MLMLAPRIRFCSAHRVFIPQHRFRWSTQSSASGTVGGGLIALALKLGRWLRTLAILFEGGKDPSRGELGECGESLVLVLFGIMSVGIGSSLGTKTICFSELFVLECKDLVVDLAGLLDRVRIRDMTGEIVSVYVLVPIQMLSFRRRPSASHQCGFTFGLIETGLISTTGLGAGC